MCVHTSMQNQANKAALINLEKAKTLTHALPRNFAEVVTTSVRTKASTAKGWYASFDLKHITPFKVTDSRIITSNIV